MPAQGDIVGGFTLVRSLGTGGMGQTWEAVRQLGSDFEQRVAIKLPRPEVVRTPDGRDLLRREASLAASLRHPNIATVTDWSEEEGFIVCELVEGAALTDVLREAPSHRLSPPLLVHVLAQVGRGLSYAHRRLLRGEPSPVVHRDMSPSNLVVDYDGNVKIVDFGIAKTVGAADRSQSVKGKLAYMAPEQAMGLDPTPALDQYALGVIAYELASGERPNDGAHDGQTLKNILNGRHVPVGRRAPELPAGLADVIERMLALEPLDRFATLDAMVEALEPFTPPLSIHRQLALLVHRAHPPETIVKEEGRFVSRPVSFELASRDLVAGSDAAGLPAGPRAAFSAHDEPAEVSEPNLTPLPPSPSSDAVVPGVLITGSLFDSPAARGDKGGRAWALALAAGLVVSVGVASWVALAPQAPESAPRGGSPPPLVLQPQPESSFAAQPAQVATAAPAEALIPVADPTRSAAASTPPRTSAKSAGSVATSHSKAPEAADSRRPRAGGSRLAATGHVRVRVKVFPWGRVWIDGVVRGTVPPILQLQLAPGAHIIAAGQESPLESRSLEIRAGDAPTISFDLGR